VGVAVKETRNRQLFRLLQTNEVLKRKGYSLAVDRDGGIVIDRGGHVHGIWNHDAQSYTWVSPGSSEPRFRTEDVKSAVLYTVVVLAQA
jgi:hypothetical protein